MSSRESLWYCHECGAEMAPIMAPHPMCASCHGEFVEKMDNTADDPREFAHGGPGDLLPTGLDTLLMALQGLSERSNPSRSRRRQESDTNPGSRITFQILDDDGHRTITFGGPNTLRPSSEGESRVPTMSERDAHTPHTPHTITGPLMAQYIMALLGQHDPIADMLTHRLGGNHSGAEGGRMGDYVFSQEALDHIMTQIMENSNANRPVPASEDVINNLQKDVLLEGSKILEKDCAICKEQFSLRTDDPDELMVVTLPCKHIFHEPCITPWLKSSGTCPVCRYALVPQPGDASTSRSNGNARQGSPPNNHSPRSPGSGSAPGLFQTFFGGFGRASDSSSRRRSNPDSSRSSADRDANHRHFPGSWEESLD